MAEASAAAAPAEGAPAEESQSASQQALNMLAGDTATGAGQTTEGTDTGPEPASNEEPPAHDDATPPTVDEEPDDLGDAGKRAIERMKTERSNAIRAQKKAESALAEREAELAEAKRTIKRLRVTSLAAGRLRDPGDALMFLTDLNGDEDDRTITRKLDKLIGEKPYLAVDKPDEKQADESPNSLERLFPDAARSLKPSDQHQVNASQFGGILEQLGISI